METFFMFAKYSPEAVEGISAERTKRGNSLIEKLGGEVKSVYALLGEYDLVFIVSFPGIEYVMKASVAMNKLIGLSITTLPAISVETFDKFASGL